MKKNTWILIALLFIFGFYELFLWQKNHSSFVKAKGEIQTLSIPIISFSSTKIKEIYVKEGDKIKKGQILACFDTSDLESKYRKSLRVGAKNQELADAAISKMLVCQENLTVRDRLLEASQFLFESGCISKEEFEKVKQHQKISLDEYSKAWKARYEAESTLSAACNKTNQILNLIRDSKVYSDFDGVVQKANFNRGDLVENKAELFNLVNEAEFAMVATLSESDVKKINIGNKARVKFNEVPDQKFDARVIYISDDAQNNGQYVVKLELDHDYKYPFRVGMEGSVFIEKNH